MHRVMLFVFSFFWKIYSSFTQMLIICKLSAIAMDMMSSAKINQMFGLVEMLVTIWYNEKVKCTTKSSL